MFFFYIFFFGKGVFKSSDQFFIELFVFLMLSFESTLYGLDMYNTFVGCVIKVIFYQTVACLSILKQSFHP